MDQLIERMLAVGARFAPIDRSGLIINLRPAERYVLTVALHGQLLKVCGEPFQILLIRQYGHGLRIEKRVVPDHQKPHQHGQIAFKGRRAEVFIHRMETR